MRALDVDASVRVLVIQGGLNDTQQDRSAVYSAATDTIALAREKFPSAQIVVLGPAPTSSTPNDGLTNVSRNIYEASADANAYAIMPIAQQWITGSNVGDVIDPATIHPSTAGHAYLAERATAALREIGPSTT